MGGNAAVTTLQETLALHLQHQEPRGRLCEHRSLTIFLQARRKSPAIYSQHCSAACTPAAHAVPVPFGCHEAKTQASPPVSSSLRLSTELP